MRWKMPFSMALGSFLLIGEDDPRTMRHELRHQAQQRDLGFWRWLWRYGTCRAFRLAQEADAWASEDDWWGRGNFAAYLASWRYLWAAGSLAEALEALDGAWRERARVAGRGCDGSAAGGR